MKSNTGNTLAAIINNLTSRVFRKEYYPLFFLLAVNVVYFAGVIAFYPGFETDDYLLFSRIQNNPFPAALNPHEVFFLFLRPVSYFTFYLDSVLWLNSPVLMKVFSLSLHLIFIVSFYLLVYRISLLLRIQFRGTLAAIILILLSFHPDISIWIIWISNRTELLYILFYALSILSVIEYLLTEKHTRLLLSAYLIFYLLSIFAKAQSLHLPVLIIFLSWVFRKKLDQRKLPALMMVSAVLTLIAAAFVIANYYLYSQETVFFHHLHKKPFMMTGVLFYCVFPYWAEGLYAFFVHNKVYAFILAFMLAAAAAAYMKREKIKYYYAVYLLVFVMIIFIPRIAYDATNRINSVQIFWLFTGLYFVAQKYYQKLRWAVLILAAAYFLINCYYNIKFSGLHKKYIAESEAQVNKLNESYDLRKDKVVVLVSLNNILVPPHAYYNREKTFGTYDAVLSPVYVFHKMYSWKGLKPVRPLVSVRINGDICTIENNDPDVILYGRFGGQEQTDFTLIDSQMYMNSHSARFFRIRIPEKYLNAEYKLIYYDGEEWRRAVSVEL